MISETTLFTPKINNKGNNEIYSKMKDNKWIARIKKIFRAIYQYHLGHKLLILTVIELTLIVNHPHQVRIMQEYQLSIPKREIRINLQY